MANIAAAGIIAKHLTDLLGTKIDTLKVFDEMFLIEMESSGEDKILNQYVKQIMFSYMTPKHESDRKRLEKQL